MMYFCLVTQEGYGTPLGQLAPYAEHLNECINECNRSDPSRRMLSQSNINCGIYCEAVVTGMAQKGISPESIPINNNFTKCEKQCDTTLPDGKLSTPGEKRKCISKCHGQNDVAQWCKELWCPYSTLPEHECMKQCFRTHTTNNNQISWSWLMSR